MMVWRATDTMIARHPYMALCSLVGVCCIALISKPPNADPSIWKRVVLRSPVEGKGELWDSNRAGLVFLGDHELLAYGVYEQNKGFSSRTEPAVTNPFVLHAWLVDSRSGDIEDQREWATHVHDSEVHATSGGVLVKTGGIVKLYSRDFKEVRDLPLPLDASSRIGVSVSPDGKTIMINQRAPRLGNAFHDRLDVFDAQTLSHRYSWDQSPPFRAADGQYSISDKGIVVATAFGRDINYTQFGSSEWRLNFNDPSRTCMAGSPSFVANDLIAIPCRELTVLTTDGKFYSIPKNIEHNSDRDSGECRPYSFRIGNTVSSGAPIIAYTLPLFKEKKFFLREAELCLMGLEVIAIDLNLRKQILNLNFPPPKHAYDFALSPDGSKLAVLEDQTVSLYSISKAP